MDNKNDLLSIVIEECQKYLGTNDAPHIKAEFDRHVQKQSKDVADLLTLIKDEDWVDFNAMSEIAPHMHNTIDALLNPAQTALPDHFENLTLLVRTILERARTETPNLKHETQNSPNEFAQASYNF